MEYTSRQPSADAAPIHPPTRCLASADATPLRPPTADKPSADEVPLHPPTADRQSADEALLHPPTTDRPYADGQHKACQLTGTTYYKVRARGKIENKKGVYDTPPSGIITNQRLT